MSAMSVMDWVVVVLACVMAMVVLCVVGMFVLAWWDAGGRDPWMEIANADRDEQAQSVLDQRELEEAVPFPDAIEHERGRVRCAGCERKDGRDG